jgi:hypothetical protein
MMNRRALNWVAILGMAVLTLTSVAMSASAASPLTGIPQAFANATGTSLATARLILSVAIIFTAGLAVAAAGKRSNEMVTAVVMVGVIGLCTGLGWLSPWLLALACVIIAILFGAKAKTVLTG